MRDVVKVVIIALVLVTACSNAEASTILYANLTNAAENPPATPTTNAGLPRPASYGFATFTLNDAETAMTFSADIFNIDFTGTQTPAYTNDDLRNAHIHAGPAVTPLTNAGVVWGFIGAPFNDNSPNDVVITPFASGVGGTVSGKWDLLEGNGTTLTAQIPNILAGRAYINFHTVQFAGGEIRGNITAVPEPATMLLVATGLAGLYRRRRG